MRISDWSSDVCSSDLASRPKKIAVPVGQGRGMIATIQQGLKDDGFAVSISQLCRWFGVPRRTVYYKPTKAPSKVNPDLAGPIKALIEEEPSFGYRTVAGLQIGRAACRERGWQSVENSVVAVS